MSKKILIAEDSQTMRSLIASTISVMGDYELIEAANGFEALRILPREKVDLVITDINMPDINGLELIRRIAIAITKQNIFSFKESRSSAVFQLQTRVMADFFYFGERHIS